MQLFEYNREGLFSGIGISVLTVIGVGIRKLLKKKEKSNDNSKILIKQVNKGTNNTQIGVQKLAKYVISKKAS